MSRVSFEDCIETEKKRGKFCPKKEEMSKRLNSHFNNWLLNHYFCWKNIKTMKMSVWISNAKIKEKLIWTILIYFRPKSHSGFWDSKTGYINFSAVIWLSLNINTSYVTKSKHSVVLAEFYYWRKVSDNIWITSRLVTWIN